jgi:hypothetical protein
MAFLGNIFTHYNYVVTDINLMATERNIEVTSLKSELAVKVKLLEGVELPKGSPFPGWKEARRYAGPLPFTFTYDKARREVLIIEGVREDWIPQPVEVVESKIGVIDSLNLAGVRLANAFMIRNVPYYWKKGRKDVWRPYEK